MTLHKLTIELSDEEIDILQQLAEQDGVAPTEALKKAIVKAAYLRQQTRSGKDILVAELKGGKITGNSNVLGVNVDSL